MAYNSGGLQSSETDGNGNVTTMTYDGLGRQMLTTFADGKYIQTLRNERDQVYITFKRSGEVHQAYYDALGRVFRIWEHAPASAQPAQPYPIGRHTNTAYDLASRPTRAFVSMQTGATYDAALERDIRTYVYDAAGRVIEDRVRPNNGVNTAWAYETDSDLAQLNHAWAPGAGQTPATFGFEHDGARRITLQEINRPDLEWLPTPAHAVTYGVANNLNQLPSAAEWP